MFLWLMFNEPGNNCYLNSYILSTGIHHWARQEVEIVPVVSSNNRTKLQVREYIVGSF